MVLLLKQQQHPNQQLNSLLSSHLPFSQSSSSHRIPPHSNLSPSSTDQKPSNLKSAMNFQLLCAQALLESNGFKLLAYDDISLIKKTISKLESQLSALNSKIKLEIKLLKASHLIRSDLNPNEDLDRFPEKFQRLYDQRESVQSQLSNLRTILFHHLSAALAHGYKQLENLLHHPTHSHHTQLSNSFSLHRSPTPSSSRPSSRSNISTTLTRFDGPHMFASDQTATSVFSPLYSQGSPEPFHPPSSPALKPTPVDQNNLFEDEIASLKALLKTKDAIIAEQSSDIDLLELEVETLKQSLTDQSSHQSQRNRNKSNLQADSQLQIESLQSQNSNLIQSLQTSNDQVNSATIQINQLNLEVDQLKSQLNTEKSDNGNRQKSNQDRLLQAQNRATAAESSDAELKLVVSKLKADLEAGQRSSREATHQVEKLQAELQSSRDREAQIQPELDSLQAQSLSKDQALISLQSENNADWEFLIDRLLTQTLKLHDDQIKTSKLSKFFSLLSSSPSRSELLKDRRKFSQELVDSFVDYMTTMNSQLAIVKAEIDSSGSAIPNLSDELEKLRQSSNQARSELMVRLNELESENEELRKQAESFKSDLQGLKINSTEIESLNLELATVKQRLAERESSASTDRHMQELWKLLPSNLDSRAAMNLDGDLGQLKAMYESPKKTAAINGGIGGLFGLGRRAATPTIPTEDVEFSIELMLEKIRLVIDNDKKLIDRLIDYEAQKDSHKNNSIRAQKLVAESNEALRIYQAQVKELEERLEYANTQSAAMLEKVNDLMGSEERSNMIARRAELKVQKLQSEIESLQLQLK